jgi:hypothetical protein
MDAGIQQYAIWPLSVYSFVLHLESVQPKLGIDAHCHDRQLFSAWTKEPIQPDHVPLYIFKGHFRRLYYMRLYFSYIIQICDSTNTTWIYDSFTP